MSVWTLKYSQPFGFPFEIDHFYTEIAHSLWEKSRVLLNGKLEAFATAPLYIIFDILMGNASKTFGRYPISELIVDRRLEIEEDPADLAVC